MRKRFLIRLFDASLFLFLLMIVLILSVGCGKRQTQHQSIEIIDKIEYIEQAGDIVDPTTDESVDEVDKEGTITVCEKTIEIVKGRHFIYKKHNGKLIKIKIKLSEKCETL